MAIEPKREKDHQLDATERETAYLLRSEAMKTRLLEAIARDGEGAISLEEAHERLDLAI